MGGRGERGLLLDIQDIAGCIGLSFFLSLSLSPLPTPPTLSHTSPSLSVASPRYGRRPRTKATARVLWLAGRAVAILPEIFLAGIFARQMASAHTYLEHKVTSGVGGRGGGGGGGGGEAIPLPT